MKSWKMVIFFFLEWVRKSLDIHNRPYANRKKKQYFLRRPQIVHAFSNIPFLDPCHGAQTELGTPQDPKKRVFGGKNTFTFLSKQ